MKNWEKPKLSSLGIEETKDGYVYSGDVPADAPCMNAGGMSMETSDPCDGCWYRNSCPKVGFPGPQPGPVS